MSWNRYSGLSIPRCVQCCGNVVQCEIECVSQAFDGGIMMDWKSVVAGSTTFSITGQTMTTTGSYAEDPDPFINYNGAQATVAMGTVASTGVAVAIYDSVSSSSPYSLAGTSTAYWRTTDAFDILYRAAWGTAALEGSVWTGPKNADAPSAPWNYLVGYDGAIFGVTDATTEGEDCVAFIEAATESHATIARTTDGRGFIPNGGTDTVLADATFTATLVRARLSITGLTIGIEYQATMKVFRRLYGTTGSWVFYEDVVTIFTATATEEFTDYSDILHVSPEDNRNDGYEYQAMECEVVIYQDPCAAYSLCFYEEFDNGTGCDDGYAAGYDAGYAAGFDCEPYDPVIPPGSFQCPPRTTCEQGTEDGYELAYSDCYDVGYSDGYDAGFIDGGC